MPTIESLLRDAQRHWEAPAALSRIGRELQGRCRFEDALRVLERAVALEPQDVDAWANLSYAHFRSLRGQEGRDALRRGIRATGSDWLKTLLAGFTNNPQDAERLWNEVEDSDAPDVVAARLGHDFWQDDADKPALFAELKALQAAHPDDEHVRNALLWTALGLQGRGELPELDAGGTALPLIEKAIAEDPDRSFGHWVLAQMHRAGNDWDGVLDATRRGLERMPDEETLMQLRGQAYREKGDEDRAVAWFQRAIGAKPSFVGARVDLGRLYERQGKLALAEEVFREGPRANPGYGLAPFGLALFLTRQGRLDEAEQVFLGAWPALPEPFRPVVRQDPEAGPLLEREAVKSLLEA